MSGDHGGLCADLRRSADLYEGSSVRLLTASRLNAPCDEILTSWRESSANDSTSVACQKMGRPMPRWRRGMIIVYCCIGFLVVVLLAAAHSSRLADQLAGN
jgi:hypothetical protein